MTQRAAIPACEAVLLSRPRLTGVERYTMEVLRAARGPFTVLVGPPSKSTDALRRPQDGPGWDVRTVGHSVAWASHVGVWRFLSRETPPFVHYFSLSPGLVRADRPFSVTIHDVSAWRFPSTASPGMRAMYRPLLLGAMRSSLFRGVITVSRFSKEEILRHFDLEASKVQIVRQSVDYVRQIEPFPVSITEPFFLHVGTIEPRKNVAALLNAFARAQASAHYKLVLVGRMGWGHSAIDALNVEWLGTTSDRQLAWLYQNATALVSTSLYEGVGLPPAEALACGCPVLLSDIGAYRELYSGHPNCRIFHTEEELSALFDNPPRRMPSSFALPPSQGLETALELLHR